MEYTYSDIEWEIEQIFESDLDGHGTREVSLIGFAYPDEGRRFGHFEFLATAQQVFPYENGYENIEIEETKFIPNEGE